MRVIMFSTLFLPTCGVFILHNLGQPFGLNPFISRTHGFSEIEWRYSFAFSFQLEYSNQHIPTIYKTLPEHTKDSAFIQKKYRCNYRLSSYLKVIKTKNIYIGVENTENQVKNKNVLIWVPFPLLNLSSPISKIEWLTERFRRRHPTRKNEWDSEARGVRQLHLPHLLHLVVFSHFTPAQDAWASSSSHLSSLGASIPMPYMMLASSWCQSRAMRAVLSVELMLSLKSPKL